MMFGQIVNTNEGNGIECLALAIPSQDKQKTSFKFPKSTNFFDNDQLRQQTSDAQRIVLALLEDNQGSRPLRLLELCECTAVPALEDAQFLYLERCPDIRFSAERNEQLLELLQSQLMLPQNTIRSASKRNLEESSKDTTASPPKRIHIEEHNSPVVGAQPQPPAPQRDTAEHQNWRQTTYNGIHYRSKLEAQTAYFMDLNGIDFRYENLSVNLGEGRTYTPDFWLPRQQLFIEIKPAYPHVEEIAKCEAVAANGFTIVLLYGRVGAPMAFEDHAPEARIRRPYDHSHHARGMAWSGQSGQRLAGEWIWLWDETEKRVVLGPAADSHDRRWHSGQLLLNYDKVFMFGPK